MRASHMQSASSDPAQTTVTCSLAPLASSIFLNPAPFLPISRPSTSRSTLSSKDERWGATASSATVELISSLVGCASPLGAGSCSRAGSAAGCVTQTDSRPMPISSFTLVCTRPSLAARVWTAARWAAGLLDLGDGVRVHLGVATKATLVCSLGTGRVAPLDARTVILPAQLARLACLVHIGLVGHIGLADLVGHLAQDLLHDPAHRASDLLGRDPDGRATPHALHPRRRRLLGCRGLLCELSLARREPLLARLLLLLALALARRCLLDLVLLLLPRLLLARVQALLLLRLALPLDLLLGARAAHQLARLRRRSHRVGLGRGDLLLVFLVRHRAGQAAAGRRGRRDAHTHHTFDLGDHAVVDAGLDRPRREDTLAAAALAETADPHRVALPHLAATLLISSRPHRIRLGGRLGSTPPVAKELEARLLLRVGCRRW
eukprot:scaffold29150_cov69-Phaeocystis_antarctica.AAC.1